MRNISGSLPCFKQPTLQKEVLHVASPEHGNSAQATDLKVMHKAKSNYLLKNFTDDRTVVGLNLFQTLNGDDVKPMAGPIL